MKKTFFKIIDKIFEKEGLAGMIIIIFLLIYTFQIYIQYEKMLKLERIIVLNERIIQINSERLTRLETFIEK